MVEPMYLKEVLGTYLDPTLNLDQRRMDSTWGASRYIFQWDG